MLKTALVCFESINFSNAIVALIFFSSVTLLNAPSLFTIYYLSVHHNKISINAYEEV